MVKKTKSKFLQVPQMAGGKEALLNYIDANLTYPEEARVKRIEGLVHLIAEIDDNGKVIQVEILKGLGGGCNEEAVRLIKNVRFGGVKNKGIRLKTKKRFRIKFQLPPVERIIYDLVNKNEKIIKPETSKTYTYTIHL